MNVAWKGMIAAAIIGVAMLGAACSDDDGGALTLDAYFEKLQKLDDQFEEDSAALDAAFESQDLDDIKSAVADGTDSTEEFIDDLDALEPPADAQEAHDEAVTAGKEFLVALRDFNDDVQDADSTDALQEIPFDAIGEASDAFNDACLGLEALAADKDIELDLNCEESS